METDESHIRNSLPVESTYIASGIQAAVFSPFPCKVMRRVQVVDAKSVGCR